MEEGGCGGGGGGGGGYHVRPSPGWFGVAALDGLRAACHDSVCVPQPYMPHQVVDTLACCRLTAAD